MQWIPAPPPQSTSREPQGPTEPAPCLNLPHPGHGHSPGSPQCLLATSFTRGLVRGCARCWPSSGLAAQRDSRAGPPAALLGICAPGLCLVSPPPRATSLMSRRGSRAACRPAGLCSRCSRGPGPWRRDLALPHRAAVVAPEGHGDVAAPPRVGFTSQSRGVPSTQTPMQQARNLRRAQSSPPKPGPRRGSRAGWSGVSAPPVAPLATPTGTLVTKRCLGRAHPCPSASPASCRQEAKGPRGFNCCHLLSREPAPALAQLPSVSCLSRTELTGVFPPLFPSLLPTLPGH